MNDTNGPTETARSAASNAHPLSSDSVFDILSEQRRRYVLHCLQKYENPMALADVADEVAVWENDSSIADISPEEVKRVYVSLYHTHVPKLSDAGIVEYSQEQDAVRLTESADELRSYGEPTQN